VWTGGISAGGGVWAGGVSTGGQSWTGRGRPAGGLLGAGLPLLVGGNASRRPAGDRNGLPVLFRSLGSAATAAAR